ncbi:hypothetical protein BDV38DRAFT_195473 [Aspergillus pseudotamarii]|uniref:Uncharacterized protein n=1 Tax=Aspergillus pseudotamarii TaxID=132259 RepID=A0A5N6SHB8_ASPPS|nr:uncharacterized protein BDV38DRAFT_195473 [Aspergillus pseudotamarii]KAE8133061.1 hypothetical protein BDV38DRAFT_195473 [Aspergillus pseudotamarii]
MVVPMMELYNAEEVVTVLSSMIAESLYDFFFFFSFFFSPCLLLFGLSCVRNSYIRTSTYFVYFVLINYPIGHVLFPSNFLKLLYIYIYMLIFYLYNTTLIFIRSLSPDTWVSKQSWVAQKTRGRHWERS